MGILFLYWFYFVLDKTILYDDEASSTQKPLEVRVAGVLIFDSLGLQRNAGINLCCFCLRYVFIAFVYPQCFTLWRSRIRCIRQSEFLATQNNVTISSSEEDENKPSTELQETSPRPAMSAALDTPDAESAKE